MLTIRRDRGDDGLTLAETLVAMVIATIAAAIGLSTFLWVFQTGNKTNDISFRDQDVRTGLAQAVALMRVAQPGSLPGATPFPTSGAMNLASSPLTFQANDSALTVSATPTPKATATGVSCWLPAATITLAVKNGQLVQTRMGPVSAPGAGASGACNYTNSTSIRILVKSVTSAVVSLWTIPTATGSAAPYAGASPTATPTKAADVDSVSLTITVPATSAKTTPASYSATAVISGGQS